MQDCTWLQCPHSIHKYIEIFALYDILKIAGWTETDVRSQYAICFHRHNFGQFVILTWWYRKCIFRVSMCGSNESGFLKWLHASNVIFLIKTINPTKKKKHLSNQLNDWNEFINPAFTLVKNVRISIKIQKQTLFEN